MGLTVDKVRKNPVQFLSLTGFTPDEFDELALEFRNEWEQYSNHFTLEGKPRQRIALLRATSILPGVQDKLLFIIVHIGVPKNISFTGTTGCYFFDEPASSQFLNTSFKPSSSQNS